MGAAVDYGENASSQQRTILHSDILSDSPIDIWQLPVALAVVKSITMHPQQVTVCYDDVDVDVDDDSRRSFTSGVRSRFPSRGGVFRLMNSVVVGSLSPAWRSAAWTLRH